MNTIEQRVLIPASPVLIWDYISHLRNNPQWQVDCSTVNFMTSQEHGRGTRWRFTNASGRESTAEITAWYDQVGYEYSITDGSSFAKNTGRIKLHETPDGTVVHWEFHYEVSGFMGSLRNSLVLRRTLENNISESLWALWEQINKLNRGNPDGYVFRSAMRDAPDVEQRAAYAPKHPNIDITKAPVKSTSSSQEPTQVSQAPIVISEPPVTVDDTRPRPAVAAEAEPETSAIAPERDFTTEPDFLTTDAIEKVDSGEDAPEREPIARVERTQAETTSEAEPAPTTQGETQTQESEPQRDRADDPAPTHPDGLDADTEPRLTSAANASILSTELIPKAPAFSDPAQETVDIDTSSMSIFEIFGVNRPGENPAATTMTEPETTENAPAPRSQFISDPRPETANYEIAPYKRVGMRIMLRRKLVRLRRPQ